MIQITELHIESIIERNFGYTFNQIKIHNRINDLKIARHFYCYLLSSELKYTSLKIGKILNRDHSTILNSLKRAQDYIDADKILREKYFQIVWQIKQIKNKNSDEYWPVAS